MKAAAVIACVVVVLCAAPASAGLEFAAEQVTRVGAQSMTGKIFFRPDRWRVEMASPEGPRVSINRLDRGVTWLLLPNRTYVEVPLRLDQIPRVAPKIEGEVKRTRVGGGKVGGRKTDKYEVIVKVNGRPETVHQWVAPDIKFPMKTAAGDGKWESAYSFVTLGTQKAELFELPAGYTKAPSPP